MIIEICANSFESARIAQECGAHRIELCVDLSVGGLTPPRALIEKVVTELSIPTHVLIRPRGGGFVYSEEDFDTILSDMTFCKEIGCVGVVSGVLNSENGIDVKRTERLITASEGMEFTFHRAFDYCKNPIQALHLLRELGVTRLLSSGQANSAVEGIELLKKLLAASNGDLQIMPGGGIRSNNVLLFKEAGFKMIHCSATKKLIDGQQTDLLNHKVEGHSDPAEIRKITSLLT
ncbi:MAG: copper homeostasis protein CutC [Bacteroidota bacterium]